MSWVVAVSSHTGPFARQKPGLDAPEAKSRGALAAIALLRPKLTRPPQQNPSCFQYVVPTGNYWGNRNTANNLSSHLSHISHSAPPSSAPILTTPDNQTHSRTEHASLPPLSHFHSHFLSSLLSSLQRRKGAHLRDSAASRPAGISVGRRGIARASEVGLGEAVWRQREGGVVWCVFVEVLEAGLGKAGRKERLGEREGRVGGGLGRF